MAKLAQDFHVNVTTDFGRIESVIQDRIDQNHARVRVAADLSAEGVNDIRQEQAVQGQLAEDALREFESQMNSPSQRTRARVTEG